MSPRESGGPGSEEMGLPPEEQTPQEEKPPEVPPGWIAIKKSDLPPDLRDAPPPIRSLSEVIPGWPPEKMPLPEWKLTDAPLVDIGRFTETGAELFGVAAEALVADAKARGLEFNKSDKEVVADFAATMERLRNTFGDFREPLAPYQWYADCNRLGVFFSGSLNDQEPPLGRFRPAVKIDDK